ncbi:MAG: prohibitin family protein [Sulfuricurvum sp.]|uniref:prohibitin family protein n=1 Tax=Sulfuricurvum sp. TaxID=2025608 RepID=UPI00263614DB|nr:prohibitin family protein [Sulfuricurvum sp.]MDD2838186.1 prohibitin family protein [Sulfuricurvum sp.]MDD3596203.1 prohibitin family protein [Sulfuricurvum sp.]MDD4883954.1 prohibitin family protein [Sulfuricurvum sp.]
MASDMNDYFNKKKNESQKGGGFQPPKPPKFDFNMNSQKAGLLWIIGGIVLLFVLAKPFIIITEGERGILSTNGKYEERSLLPGLHFLIPFIQKVYLVDTKVRIINYADKIDRASTAGDGIVLKPAITVLDKRGLPVSIELTVQYRLNPQLAAQTISNWGFSWEDKIIDPVARDIVRNVVGQYEAENLPIMRNAIAQKIEVGIRNTVEGQKNAPAQLESIQLREIGLPQKVKDQIERVQVAKQEVERAQQDVERAKQEAFKKETEAQGTANAITIQAQAQAKANRLIADSLTPGLLKLEQIQVQGKFNEALKENKDAKIFLTPGGSTPNIWVDMKTESTQKVSSVK